MSKESQATTEEFAKTDDNTYSDVAPKDPDLTLKDEPEKDTK